VINLKEKRFEYCDSAHYRDNFFSSIVRPALQFYLEYKQRQWFQRQQPKTIQLQDFSRFLERTLTTPRQYNAIDCGAFVCMFVTFIVIGETENYRVYDDKIGEFIAKPNMGTIFRSHIGRELFMN